jgi:hypothetical protein
MVFFALIAIAMNSFFLKSRNQTTGKFAECFLASGISVLIIALYKGFS